MAGTKRNKSGCVSILVSPFYASCLYLYHGVDGSTDNWQKMQIMPDSKLCTYYKSPFKQPVLLYTLVNVKIATCANYLLNWRTQLKTLQLLNQCWIQRLKRLDGSLGWDARERTPSPEWPKEGHWAYRRERHTYRPRTEGCCSLTSDPFQRWTGITNCSLNQCYC